MTTTPRPTATVAFERIGRDQHVPSVSLMSDDADVIAQAVFAHARHYLASTEIEVTVDLDEPEAVTGTVRVYVGGFRLVGTGKVSIIYA